MKKSVYALLLAIICFPVFALFGCGSKQSFSVTVSTCGTAGISAPSSVTGAGSGSFTEGSTVTLTASNQNHFVGWIFQNTQLLKEDSTYSITNTTDDLGYITQSVLTFKSSAKTQGNYTAVFDDGKIYYTKFYSWFVTTDETRDTGINEVYDQSELMKSSIDVKQRQQRQIVYTAENHSTVENKIQSYDDEQYVLNLNPANNTKNIVSISATFTVGEVETNETFNYSLSFKTSDTSMTPTVTYKNGVYTAKCPFKITELNDDITYYLVVKYVTIGYVDKGV